MAQEQIQEQKQSGKGFQIQKAYQAYIPVAFEQIEEDDENDDEIISDPNDLYNESEDDSPEYDDLDYDEIHEIPDIYSEFEQSLEGEKITLLKHYPCAEIQNFNDEFIIILGSFKVDDKSKVIKVIINKIIESNKAFLKNMEGDIVPINQYQFTKEINSTIGMQIGRETVSRYIHNNYITLPNNIDYQLSLFFNQKGGRIAENGNERGNKTKDILKKEEHKIKKMLNEKINVVKEDLFSDYDIAIEIFGIKNESNRIKVVKLRKDMGIKSIQERLKYYIEKYT